MLTEKTLRQRIDSIWQAELHPVRRTKLLLRMSQQTRAFAQFLMRLGFNANHEKDKERTRRFWAAAATFFSIADEVRDQAGRALLGRERKIGFGYGPSAYAVPSWEREVTAAPPQRRSTIESDSEV